MSDDESEDQMNVDEIEKIRQRIKNPYRYIEDRLEHGD